MAVRFDADAEDYTRALTLGSQSALTMCSWYKISVDRNTWSSAWFIDNGQTDNWGVQTAEDGVTVGTVLDGNSTAGFAATVGTWYFIAFASSGTTGTFYYKAAGAASLSTVAISGVTATNAATLRLGESPWGAEWLNGCLAAVKAWNIQLTQAEIEIEAAQYVPNRVSSLVGFYPLVRPETTDYSGNGRTLSGGTGAAVEDGPPIPWRGASPRLILPVSVGGTNAVAENAAATGAANNPSASIKPAGGDATAIATANNAAPSVDSNSQAVTATASANNAAAEVNPNAGNASATATAETASTSIKVNAECATATATANNATVATGAFVSALAECATATAIAGDVDASLDVAPATASATAAVQENAASINAAAVLASASAVINNAAASIGALVAAAAATATANQPAALVSVAAASATATASAGDATIGGGQVNGTSTPTVSGLASVPQVTGLGAAASVTQRDSSTSTVSDG